MGRTLLLTTAICLATGLLLRSAGAIPMSGVASIPTTHRRIVAEASWHCWRWRHICAHRWGWGMWQFNRCLERHACR